MEARKLERGMLAIVLFMTIILSMLVLPSTVHAIKRLNLTGMGISNDAPIEIDCGATVTLNCWVSYSIDDINFSMDIG